jgi:hypothetical protein
MKNFGIITRWFPIQGLPPDISREEVQEARE